MNKLILMGAALILCTALAIAQDTPSSGSSNSQAGTSASSSDQNSSSPSSDSNSIQGCLTGTSGNYMLTDATGVTYQLTGEESQLSANVNKEVEVMGTAGAKASASAGNNPDSNAASGSSNSGDANSSAGTASGTASSASANANAAKTLEVTSVKKVADSCSSGK